MALGRPGHLISTLRTLQVETRAIRVSVPGEGQHRATSAARCHPRSPSGPLLTSALRTASMPTARGAGALGIWTLRLRCHLCGQRRPQLIFRGDDRSASKVGRLNADPSTCSVLGAVPWPTDRRVAASAGCYRPASEPCPARFFFRCDPLHIFAGRRGRI